MLATCSKFSQAAPPLSRPNPLGDSFGRPVGVAWLSLVPPKRLWVHRLGVVVLHGQAGEVGWGLVAVHLLEF
jgi:hypothetical protein